MKKNTLLIALFLLTGITYGQTAQWARATGGPDQLDIGSNILADTNGNTYASGIFRQTTNFDSGNTNITEVAMQYGDVYVQKLSPTGSLLWVKVFKNEMRMESSYLTLDGSNNLYLTSQFTGSIDLNPGNGTDIHTVVSPYPSAYVVKLSSSGEYIWGKHFQFGSIINSGIETTGIEIDNENNILLTGEFQNSIDFDFGNTMQVSTATGRNNFIIKIDKEGGFIWNKIFASNLYGRYRINDIATDSQNNIILAGGTYGNVYLNPPSGNYIQSDVNYPDLAIVKLGSNGDFIWAKTAQGTMVGNNNSAEQANAIAIDANNNIYFSGNFTNHINLEPSNTTFVLDSGSNDSSQSTPFFGKMNSESNLLWAKKLDGGISTNSSGRTASIIDINDDGRVFVGMNYLGTFTYTVNGLAGSNTTYNDPSRGQQMGMSLAEISPSNGNYLNMYHLKNIWHIWFHGLDIRNNSAYISGRFSATLDFGNSVSITTATGGYTGQDDAFAAQISYNTLGIAENVQLSNTILLFPNPVHNQLNINTDHQKIKKITLIDLTGKKLGNILPSLNESIYNIDVSQLASGTYFLTIYTEKEIISKKFLKL
ncbi:T9SS type A sorting domain-containing protein [Flavobacterium sp. LB3P45]|uniref:T9SS type A sorting domain-containing protein n=1 Tax=Flavobacterium fructosi TaxID=3230416 RepID=A0ABW6HIW2_9FLAO